MRQSCNAEEDDDTEKSEVLVREDVSRVRRKKRTRVAVALAQERARERGYQVQTPTGVKNTRGACLQIYPPFVCAPYFYCLLHTLRASFFPLFLYRNFELATLPIVSQGKDVLEHSNNS